MPVNSLEKNEKGSKRIVKGVEKTSSIKTKLIGLLFILLFIGISVGGYIGYSTYFGQSNWPIKYADEFDRFFGEDNWENIDTQWKESQFFSTTIHTDYGSGEDDGTYQNWDIAFTNLNGEEEVWGITNHSLLINQSENWIFSKKRRNGKQGLILEFYGIASGSTIKNEVREQFLSPYMTEEMMDCFRVELDYLQGRPSPEDYDALWAEEWFTLAGATLKDFLQFSDFGYGLEIFLFDYKFEKLSEEDQGALLSSMEKIAADLEKAYGLNTSFSLYFGEGYELEMEHGVMLEA